MLVSMYSYLFSRVLTLAISKTSRNGSVKIKFTKVFGIFGWFRKRAGYCKFCVLIWLGYLPRSKIRNSPVVFVGHMT